MLSFRWLAILLAALSSTQAMAGTPAPFSYEAILGPGQTTELGAGVAVQPFGTTINDAGDIAFLSQLSGAGVDITNSEALWLYQDDAGLLLLARSGRPAPGFGFQNTYSDLYQLRLDDSGAIAFTGQINGPGIDSTNDQVLWTGTAQAFLPRVQDGNPIPGGTPAGFYSGLSGSVQLGAGGHLVLIETYALSDAPGSFAQALVFGLPDQLSTYATTAGQPTPGGLQFADFRTVQVNGQGQLALYGNLVGGPQAIWSDASGALTEVMTLGQQAPGFQAGVTFTNLQAWQLLDGGQVGFQAALVGPGIQGSSDNSYWTAQPGATPQLMVQDNDVLPHRAGTTMLRALTNATSNINGRVAFSGELRDVEEGLETAVWFGTPGDYQLVIQAGDEVPGYAGYRFGDQAIPMLNDRDLLVFSARLILPGNSTPTRQSVWAYRDGVLVPLVVDRTLLDVALPGEEPDVRRIDGIMSLSTSLDNGSLRSLNHQDQLALSMLFTDGSSALLRFDLTGVFAPGLPGDLTGDEFVGAEDLDVLLANWGQTTFAGSWRDGDADGDGVVGAGDLQLLIDHWSEGTPPDGVVPEPATGAWLASLWILLGRRLRHGLRAQGIIAPEVEATR